MTEVQEPQVIEQDQTEKEQLFIVNVYHSTTGSEYESLPMNGQNVNAVIDAYANALSGRSLQINVEDRKQGSRVVVFNSSILKDCIVSVNKA